MGERVSICLGAWIAVPDGDARARAIYLRHYSARHYRDGRRRGLFVGPGGKMVLLTPECDALFVWRRFINDDGQQGVNCAVFRNEGPRLSSDLIREACELAWVRWSGERLYTYVAPRKIRSTNPGYCFLMAGWTVCGQTKGGLVILEKIALTEPDGYERQGAPAQLWPGDAPLLQGMTESE